MAKFFLIFLTFAMAIMSILARPDMGGSTDMVGSDPSASVDDYYYDYYGCDYYYYYYDDASSGPSDAPSNPM